MSTLSISVVSHGHGDMLWKVVNQIAVLHTDNEIIVTLNIPEEVPEEVPCNVKLIRNLRPLGFAENHNQAFAISNSEFFCVLNPDIEIVDDPFTPLMDELNDQKIGIIGPRVLNGQGRVEDSLRQFLTPWSIAERYLFRGDQNFTSRGKFVFPDWIAGMFMIFRSENYRLVNGFDTDYFMYCEDADICARVWAVGKLVVSQPNVMVVHHARRATRRSIRHMYWHLKSLVIYFMKRLGRHPNINTVINRLVLD